MGAGWNLTGPAPGPTAIAAIVEMPWNAANAPDRVELALLDSGGTPVLVSTPTGEQPTRLTADFEIGRPAGARPGSSLNIPIAINIGPFPLAPGRTYEWRCSTDGEAHEGWTLPFSTRAPRLPRPR